MEIAALHSYDEVKMVFIYGEKEREEWDFARWLPHTWDEADSMHYMVSSPAEAREISASLERRFAARSNPENSQDPLPWYVVFVADRTLEGRRKLFARSSRKRNAEDFLL